MDEGASFPRMQQRAAWLGEALTPCSHSTPPGSPLARCSSFMGRNLWGQRDHKGLAGAVPQCLAPCPALDMDEDMFADEE